MTPWRPAGEGQGRAVVLAGLLLLGLGLAPVPVALAGPVHAAPAASGRDLYGQDDLYGYVDENGVLFVSTARAGESYRPMAIDRGLEAGRESGLMLGRFLLRGGRFATGEARPWRSVAPRDEASRRELEALIQAAAARHGLDPGLARAVAEVESGLDARAVSPKGAAGVMQVMPATGRELGLDDPMDPAQNIEAGVIYLRRMLDRFGTTELALAAYNAGPGAVERSGGVPGYPETQDFVARVLGRYGAGGR